MQRLISACLLGIIILLTIYAPLELTRVIFLWADEYHWIPDFYIEIPFIWVGYISAMVIVGIRLWGLSK